LAILERLEELSLSYTSWANGNEPVKMGTNTLSGGLPSAWGQGMQSLRVLKLNMIGKLEQIELAQTSGPWSFWPSEWNFPKLEKLLMNRLGLAGTLPDDLPKRLPRLRCLDLGNNALFGTLPQSYRAIPWSETACPRDQEADPFSYKYGGFAGNSGLRGCAAFLPESFVRGTLIGLNDSNCGVPEWLQNQNRAMLALRDMLMPLRPEAGSDCDSWARLLKHLIPDSIDGVNASSRAWDTPYCGQIGLPTSCRFDIVDMLPRLLSFFTLQSLRINNTEGGYKNVPGACIPSLKGGFNISALVHDILPLTAIKYLELGFWYDEDSAWPMVGHVPPDISSILPDLRGLRLEGRCLICESGISLPNALGNIRDLTFHESLLSRTSSQHVVRASLPANWVDDIITAANMSNRTLGSRYFDPILGYSLFYDVSISVKSDAIVGTIPRAWGKPGYNVLIHMYIEIKSNSLAGCFPDRLHPAWKLRYAPLDFFDPNILPLKYCGDIDGQKLALSGVLATMSKAKLTSRGKARLNTWIADQGSTVANLNRDPRFCVSWAGVVCDDEGWVRGLDLSGCIAPSSALLLSVLVPQMLALPNLKFVSLRGNGLRGTLPASLVALTELESIDLSRNSLNGTLPSAWLAFNQLQVLRLSFNRFSGSIPATWCMMQSLRDLQVARNSLSGSLPAAFGLLQNLEVLDMSANGVGLTGGLPVAWADASLVPVVVAEVQSEVQEGVAAAKEAAAEALAGLEEGAKETRKWLVPSTGPQAGLDAVELIAVQAANGPALDVRVGAAAEQVLQRAARAVALAAKRADVVAVAGGDSTLLRNLRTMYLGGNGLTGSLIAQWSSLTSLKVSLAYTYKTLAKSQ
jgi:Leucine-rich repeat (LRR) protein